MFNVQHTVLLHLIVLLTNQSQTLLVAQTRDSRRMKNKSQAYLEARKRLQQLHRQRQTSSRGSSERQDGSLDQQAGNLRELLDFIENGNEDTDYTEGISDPKKAAKKARQKQRKASVKSSKRDILS